MKAETRTAKLKDVREEKKVAGVVYGKALKSTPIQTSFKDFAEAYSNYGKSMTFQMTLDGKKHQVYFKEVQVDPLRQNNVVHFDLQKISKTDKITADIPVQVLNQSEVESRGLIVELISNTVDTEFPAGSGISHFELDVEGLEGNDALYVRDLDLPKGFKVLDPEDKIVISISYPQEEEEEEIVPEEDEELEVEAIKQKGDDDEASDSEDDNENKDD